MGSKLENTFENFVADFQRFGDYVVIDWHNANGSSNCRVRYVINEADGELHISGDLGSAVFYWYSHNTWQDLATYSKSLDYFLSKAETSSESPNYDYERAVSQLKWQFERNEWNEIGLDEFSYDEFIDSVMYGWNPNNGTIDPDLVDDYIIEFLHDNEIYVLGDGVSDRKRLWAIGMQMILDQYGDDQS
jgi:hypothetical protein